MMSMTTEDDDNWLTAAITDSVIVADLLVTLRQSSTSSPPPPLRWTIHQRRSRTQLNKSEPPRASPSTPLSWTTGTASIADDNIISRSNKVTPPNETTPIKMPRKKKTLAALKEEEVLLVEEQMQLKRKIAALQDTREKQRKQNECLKQMKMDMQIEPQVVRPTALRFNGIQQPNSHFEVINEQNDKFVLPDLNVPAGEDAIMSY